MQSMTRQQAAQRLQEVHAQMFVLGEEAKMLAGYLNGSAQEDRELNAAKQAVKELDKEAPSESVAEELIKKLN